MDYGYCIEYFDKIEEDWKTTHPFWFDTLDLAKASAKLRRKRSFGNYADEDLNIMFFVEIKA